jgi:hypothetical protein
MTTRPQPKDWGEFQDTRAMEAQARIEHGDRLANLKHSVSLCDGILQLEASAGFKHLQQTLTDMLEHRTRELLSVREDRAAAVLQGRCQELRVILSLMAQARGNREALAKAITDEEDRFSELERHFKPIPQEQNS